MSGTEQSSSTNRARTVACPNCGCSVLWSTASPFRPFCSERCKLIDLGQWADEQYRVPVSAKPDETQFD